MGKPHPMELRTRVVEFVEEGHSHREATRRFMVQAGDVSLDRNKSNPLSQHLSQKEKVKLSSHAQAFTAVSSENGAAVAFQSGIGAREWPGGAPGTGGGGRRSCDRIGGSGSRDADPAGDGRPSGRRGNRKPEHRPAICAPDAGEHLPRSVVKRGEPDAHGARSTGNGHPAHTIGGRALLLHFSDALWRVR